jgi:hypothetical protein
LVTWTILAAIDGLQGPYRAPSFGESAVPTLLLLHGRLGGGRFAQAVLGAGVADGVQQGGALVGGWGREGAAPAAPAPPPAPAPAASFSRGRGRRGSRRLPPAAIIRRRRRRRRRRRMRRRKRRRRRRWTRRRRRRRRMTMVTRAAALSAPDTAPRPPAPAPTAAAAGRTR